MNPLTLVEAYEKIFGKLDVKNKNKTLSDILACLDVKLFGATFAAKKSQAEKINLSVHGPVQINHGVNRYPLNEIYSEQIMSPFRNPSDKETEEKGMTTLGQQSKLREGHYVHHFSINPQNLASILSLVEGAQGLTDSDIEKLKIAMRNGVTYFDSASKAGSDNELLLWVQLKLDSKLVLPVFTEFINVTRDNGNVVIDFGKLNDIFTTANDQIDFIEVFYNPGNIAIKNLPESASKKNITTNKEINHEG